VSDQSAKTSTFLRERELEGGLMEAATMQGAAERIVLVVAQAVSDSLVAAGTYL